MCVVVMLFSDVLVLGLIGKNRFLCLSVLLSCLCVILGCIVIVRLLVLMCSIWFMCDIFRLMLLCMVSRWFFSDELVLNGMRGMWCLVYRVIIWVILVLFCVKMMVWGGGMLKIDLL